MTPYIVAETLVYKYTILLVEYGMTVRMILSLLKLVRTFVLYSTSSKASHAL